jgi:hypothetical protein
VPIGIGEGVELFDIAKRMARLPLDPGSQARLERAMANLERARRQGAPVLDRHRERTPVGDGDEHSDELNAGRLRSCFLGHNLVAPHCSPPYRFLRFGICWSREALICGIGCCVTKPEVVCAALGALKRVRIGEEGSASAVRNQGFVGAAFMCHLTERC